MKKLILGITAALILLFQALPVAANTACSEGMIRNSYGFVGETAAEGLGYCGATGVFTFKGDGTVVGVLKQSCSGILLKATGTGTYKVWPNCTAIADVEFSDGDSGRFHFTIVDGGKKIFAIGEQPGITFTMTGEQL